MKWSSIAVGVVLLVTLTVSYVVWVVWDIVRGKKLP